MGTEKRQRKKENRQARLEAERAAAARAKRRKQLVTAVVVTLGVLVVLIALSWGAGDDDTDTAADGTTTTTGPTDPAEAPTTTTVPVRPASEAPEVTVPEGEPPAELQTEDLVEGDGEEAQPGDTVTVNYTGVAWSTGEQFDSSWGEEGGQAVTFPLDQVIPGWTEGIPGMRVGGRRQLVIPPDLAYGDTPPPGSGIEPGETLVFVVDLEAVG